MEPAAPKKKDSLQRPTAVAVIIVTVRSASSPLLAHQNDICDIYKELPQHMRPC